MKTVRLGLIFWAAAALAQFPFPRQYPGGYPGGSPYPNRRYPPQQQPQQQQSDRRSNRASTMTTDGMVRRVSGNQLIIEADDHRIVWFRITGQTAAHKDGNTTDVGRFQPGDRVSVDSSEDDTGNLTATQVEWVRAGTIADRQAAQETWDLPGSAELQASANGPARRDPSRADDDDDRPILRRKNSDSTPENPPAAQTQPAPPQQAQNAPAAPASPDDSSTAGPATQDQPPPPPRDADDPGRPVLRHGGAETARQQPAANASPTASATPAPSSAPALTGVPNSDAPARPRPQQTIAAQEDPLIAKVREAAYAYSSTLPNFMCQQATTRYHTANLRQGWDTIDIVTADVAYENGQERYRNIKVGDHSVASMDAVGGASSTGEFSSMLQDLMSPYTAATFRRDGTDTLRGRAAIVFALDVQRDHSHWRVEAPSQLYYPAYKGSIWIDRETSRVLRIELQARNLPVQFPFDTVESATDYDFIRLAAAEQEFLLPANAEVLSCERGTSFCSRNRIEFRNYKKFDAASSISFK